MDNRTNYLKDRAFLLTAAVLCLTFLVHSSYIANGFTWLDHGDIEAGLALRPLGELLQSFFSPYGATGFFRPIVTIVNSLDYAFYGKWAAGYHLTNVLLHLGVTAAAISFSRIYFGLKREASLLVGLIVGVHPLSWLPVGAIAYRPELLAALFVLVASIFHIRYRTDEKLSDACIAIAAALCSLFSKESAVIWIVGLLALWELGRHREGSKKPFVQHSLFFASELAALTAYMIIRQRTIGAIWHLTREDIELPSLVFTQLQVLSVRFWELVTPILPRLSDATVICSQPSLGSTSAAAIVILIFAAILKIGVATQTGSALLVLAIVLLPALNLLPLPRFSSPHYGYFAVVPFAVLVIMVLRLFAARSQLLVKIANAILILWVASACISTYRGGYRFQNDFTLFTSAVTSDPEFREGAFYLAGFWERSNSIDTAENYYKLALRQNSAVLSYVDYDSLLINYAGLHVREGRLEQAEILLEQAAEIAPPREQSTIAYNRALVAFRQGQFERTVTLLGPHIESPKRPEPVLLYADALRRLGRNEEAEMAMRRSANRHQPALRTVD